MRTAVNQLMDNDGKRARKKRGNPEQAFQIKLVRDLSKILPPDCVMTAFPAGGGGRIRGGILKRMGLIPGMPDLLFLHRGNAFGMELKAGRGRLNEAQTLMHPILARCGVDVRVVRTLDDALGCLKEWEIPTRIIEARA